MRNSRRIVKDFLASKALVQLQDLGELEQHIRHLLNATLEAQAIGDEAAKLVAEKAGALTRTVEQVRPLV